MLPLHRPVEGYPDAVVVDGWSWHLPGKPQPAGDRTRGRSRRAGTDGTGPWEPQVRPLSRIGRTALVTLAVTAVVGFLAVRVVGLVASLRWLRG